MSATYFTYKDYVNKINKNMLVSVFADWFGKCFDSNKQNREV